MNEELKIIIRAVTDEAKRNLSEVREELDNINNTGKTTGKSVDEAMKAVGKGAAVAVGAIAALTTALVALGKSSLEFQKQQAKLIAGFQAAGSSAQQANKTYKDLFRFMGDSDAATEAAQSLARLTTSTEDLSEWTKILQGVYARAGNAIPVESLAEAANETVKVGVVTGSVADALNWLGVSEDAFNEKLAQTNSLEEREILLRSTLNSLYGNAASIYERNNQSLLEYNESQANLDIAMARAAKYVVPLMTSLNNLSATLLTFLAPAIEVVAVYLTAFIQLMSEAIQWVGSFFGLFSSGAETATADVEGYRNAMNDYMSSLSGSMDGANSNINETIENLEKLKKQTMGFDELNIVQSPVSTGSAGGSGGVGGGGSVGGLVPPNPADFGIGAGSGMLDGLKNDLEEAKEKIQSVLFLAGLVAATFVTWKIASFIQNLQAAIKLIKNAKILSDSVFAQKAAAQAQKYLDNLKGIAGKFLIIAGVITVIVGYSDAWVNGIDWGNFATILGGIALTVGGLYLSFGSMAAAIGVVVGGIALIVLGIKDFVENGYSMQNVLAIAAGALLVLVGVCWAFNAALLANPITWIIAAILALVAVFVILWNECEGFRNFWIGLWEKIKTAFAAVVESLKPLFDAIVNAFKQAWELIKVIWDLVAPYFQNAWDKIKLVWDGVVLYFSLVWEGIKLVFTVVSTVLTNYFKAAWENIKAVWSVVVAYFKAIWDTIAGIFSVVKNVLTGNWKGAWESIKGIVGSWANYFKTVWESIKKIFGNVGTFFKDTFTKVGSAIGEAISNTVKKAVNGVLSMAIKTVNVFIGAINAAIGIINAIPGVEIKKLDKLDVPKMARGGIVNSATVAMIGEAGKEAVLPLENNTGWMDALADRIAARSSSPSRIVLQVGERELGYATIGAINNITEQTGNLPLVLA